MLTERSARIVAAHKLLRRSRRAEAGEFLAEGAPAVAEAIAHARDNPGVVLELYLTEAAGGRHTDAGPAGVRRRDQVTQVTDRAAASLTDAVTPQGLVVRCTLPDDHRRRPAGQLTPKLVAVLVQTNDPGNTGTVIRLADAAGADGVIVAGDAADPLNPKAMRASAGSLFHLPVVPRRDPAALVGELAAAGLSVLAPTGQADLELGLGRSRRHPGPADRLAVRLGSARAAGRDHRPGRRAGADPDLRAGRVAEPGRRRRGLPVRQRRRAPPGGLTAGRDGPVG